MKAYNTGLIGNLSPLSPCKRPILIASGLIFSSMGPQDCKNLQIETYVRYIPDLVDKGSWMVGEVGKLEHWVRWNARPFIEFSGYVYAQSAMCCWCLALLSRDFSTALFNGWGFKKYDIINPVRYSFILLQITVTAYYIIEVWYVNIPQFIYRFKKRHCPNLPHDLWNPVASKECCLWLD